MKKNNKKLLVMLVAAFVFLGLAGIVMATLAPGAIDLGRANSFAVLAGGGTTNTGTTTITGDVGAWATVSQTGLGSETIYGINHLGTQATQDGKTDLTAALTTSSTAGSTQTATPGADSFASFSNLLTPGVYTSSSTIGISAASPLVLNGQGNPNAVFIFQAGSALTSANSSSVTLENGAQACNVFWYVYSDVTLGTNSHIVGTIMADQGAITANTGAIINGRLLASVAAVNLDTATITVPTCAPHLTLRKVVDNTGGGTANPNQWNLTASGSIGAKTILTGAGPTVDSDVVYPNADFAAATHTLFEDGGPSNYTASLYSCVINGGTPVSSNTLTLAAGDVAVCTITNTYGGGGGTVSGGCSLPSSLVNGVCTAPSTTVYPAVINVVTTTQTPVVTPIVVRLPKTGFPPQENNTPWEIIAIVSFFLISIPLYVVRKK